jgi:hypothetical protein
MPRTIVQAETHTGRGDTITLSERIVAANLHSPHYVAQLIERLRWATADAEVPSDAEMESTGPLPAREPARI